MFPNEIEIPIVGGCNRADLLAQLFDIGRCRGSRRPRLLLHVAENTTTSRAVKIEVTISGLEAEDGSGNRWLITGHIHTMAYMPGWLRQRFESGNLFHGYYDTRTRTGFLNVGARRY